LVIDSLALDADTRIVVRAASDTIERLSEEIAASVAERQALRAAHADADALERNRLAICVLQRRLADAFIAHYFSARAEAA
jgi:hypothetical protein